MRIQILLPLFATLWLPAIPASAEDSAGSEIKYTISIAGRTVGGQEVGHQGPGRVHAEFHCIEVGYEDSSDALNRSQLAAIGEQLKAMAGRLTHHYAEPILIRDARVLDAEHAMLGPAQDVCISEGRIAALFPAGSEPRQAGTVFEAEALTLLPGLFDMHDHESPWNAVHQLACGVTSARDMGNDNAVLARLRAAVDRGDALGAHIIPAGFIEGRSPYSSNTGILVEKPEWVAAAARHAHELGLRVSGHVPAFSRAEDAIRDGYDEVQHVNQLLLNFFVKPDTDTRTLARFTLIKGNAHGLDLDSVPVQDFIRLIDAETGIRPAVAALLPR